MTDNLEIIKQGAEAKLYMCTYLGKPTLIKERFLKKYRHRDLDSTITFTRMRNEARAIVRCKTAGINTPSLYLVDFVRRRIYMEYFENSTTVKDHIITAMKKEGRVEALLNLTKIIGENVRKLHDNNIIHGDLTTSNMLLVYKQGSTRDYDFVMIDFGLSYTEGSAEDKGVDLYVLERAVISTHNDVLQLFPQILDAYKNSSKSNIKEIMSKYEEVRARGRKRTMIG